jgi:cytochrome b
VHIIRIWDGPTRLFHWSLAACFAGLFITGKTGGDAMDWHFRLGYLMATLLLFRVVWGLIGGHWSRFSSFRLSPRTVLEYVRGLGAPELTAGHSPLGTVSILAMLLLLFVQVGTGLFSEDIGGEAFGPLSRLASRATVRLVSGYHKGPGQTILLFFVILHLAAVALYYVGKKNNLVWPMITGDKHLPVVVTPSRDDRRSRVMAAAVLALCAVAVSYVVKLSG